MTQLHTMNAHTSSLCSPCLGGELRHADYAIHWLVQSTTDHPCLPLGQAPLGVLSGAEEERLAGLTHPKRRRDWLLGRWTAKHLLQAMLQHTAGARLPLKTLVIRNDPDGAPFACLDAQAMVGVLGAPVQADHRLPLSLSISHSGPYSFCAVSALQARTRFVDRNSSINYHPPSISIGADIEHIETRGAEFVTDFFTDEEIKQVRTASTDARDTLITAIWSAKEAVLKALRLGLTIDTRRVICHMDNTNAPSLDGWLGFTAAAPTLIASSTTLTGWWWMMNDFVLTLAVKCET